MNTLSEVCTVLVEEVMRGSGRLSYRIIGLSAPVILVALLIAMPLVRGVFLDDEDGQDDRAGARLGVVDLAGVLHSRQPGSAGMQSYTDRRAGTDALAGGEITDLFVVPADYLATGRVEWLSAGSETFQDDDAGAVVEAFLREAIVAGRLSYEAESRFLAPPTIASRTVQPDGTILEEEDDTGFQAASYVFAMVMAVSVMFGGGMLLESVSEEKETRMVEIILTSVSPLGMMGGKVLGQGALSLAQVALWVGSLAAIGPLISDQLPQLSDLSIKPALIVWAALFFVAGYFVVAALMSAIGSMTPSYTQSSQLSALVVVPVILPVMIPQFILSSPDGALARALSFFPVTAPVTVIMRLGQTDLSLVELLASLTVTVLGGVILLYLSARIFRAGSLLYGQRMTLRGALRALLER